jgi:type I restriction enzyme S subunit
MAKLGELGKIITGNTPKTSDAQNYESNDICFVKPSDFTDNEITEIHQSEFYISAYAKDKARVLPTDSILVTCIGIIGKVAINKVPCAFNQQINAIVPEKKVCNPRYIAYAIQNLQPKMQSTANAAVVPILNKTQFSNLEVPLLPVGEQKQIACNLNKIDKLISLRKQQLAKLDELVKARFVEMFGVVHNSVLYPYVPVRSFTSVVSGGTPNRNVAEFWNNGSIRWVKTTELQNNVICNTDEKITQAGLDNSSAKIIPPNTVLIAMYGQGKTRGMTGYTSIECATNQACACILPCEQFNQNYLWRYMILSYDKLRDMAKGGNQPNLNIGIIKNFPVLKPPIELQNDFAAFVERVDQQKQTIQQSLEKLELMKKALMQEFFG